MASLAAGVVLLSACGSIAAEPIEVPGASDAPPTSIASVAAFEVPLDAAASAIPSPPERRVLQESDLVNYIAVVADMLTGTIYADGPLESPGVFLATGTLFCEQLDAGMSRDEVLVEYIETLTGGAVDDASEDALTMAGAVLGVGLVTICPDHLATKGAAER